MNDEQGSKDTDTVMIMMGHKEQHQAFLMFFDYLLRTKSECKYFKNLHRALGEKTGIEYIEDMILSPYNPDLLRLSFEWNSTKQGMDYWSKLSLGWEDCYYYATGFSRIPSVETETLVVLKLVELLSFLVDYDIAKPFFKQCRREAKKKGWTINELITGMINTDEQSEWFMTLFVWCDSKKGRQYWLDVNALWIEYLNE